jgi:hypothetical protein
MWYDRQRQRAGYETRVVRRWIGCRVVYGRSAACQERGEDSKRAHFEHIAWVPQDTPSAKMVAPRLQRREWTRKSRVELRDAIVISGRTVVMHATGIMLLHHATNTLLALNCGDNRATGGRL